jgi:hypothetical protein
LNHSSFEDGYESQNHRPKAWNLREQIAGAAQAKVQKILVLGEGGTGKEATANAIHRLSKRANGPFVSRNAASFAMSVVMGFGHGFDVSGERDVQPKVLPLVLAPAASLSAYALLMAEKKGAAQAAGVAQECGTGGKTNASSP